jgi:hypothetical protein
MIFKPFHYYETGCAAYLYGCGSLGKCAVVDAHEHDIAAYAEFATAKGMQITHIIDTHVHADHRSGGLALAQLVGAHYCLHESADVASAFTALHDGQTIELGNTSVTVLHTPGHTPESISLLVTDHRRGAAQGTCEVARKYLKRIGERQQLLVNAVVEFPRVLPCIPGQIRPPDRANKQGAAREHKPWITGHAIGALLAGIAADFFGLVIAMWTVAALTLFSGVVVAIRMTETIPKHGRRLRADVSA